jgi:hypothetical protein
MTRRPLVVIEGPQQVLTSVLAMFEAGGWIISRGLQVPTTEWSAGGLVCVGTVASPSDAALAVLAAARGAGVVLAVSARDETLERLVEDLSRIGPVDYWPRESGTQGALNIEQWCLLELLAQGRTLAEAAAILHLSRRTADRKVASARLILGAKSTAEAVLVMQSTTREGWSHARPD